MSRDPLDSWLIQAVGFYRARGFFRQVPGTDEEAAAWFRPLVEVQDEGEEITLDDLESPEFDLFFLSLDPLRTLYESMTFGSSFGPGLGAYVDIVTALAKISRGAFAPQAIEETWESADGPIVIRFKLGEASKTLKVDTWGGMFDFRILLQLDLLLWDTPYRFEMAPLDDILFVTVLTAEERTELERHRGLSFMVLDLPRNFLPLANLAPALVLPEDPELAVHYRGTLNENLDRCVGRLTFVLRGERLEGEHRYQGEAHQEDLRFSGTLDKTTSMLSGRLEGFITVDGEPRAYQGQWKGRMAPGQRVMTGTWRGWFPGEVDDEDGQVIYEGQWGLLEEGLLAQNDRYIERTRVWLDLVGESRSSADYPWLLPS